MDAAVRDRMLRSVWRADGTLQFTPEALELWEIPVTEEMLSSPHFDHLGKSKAELRVKYGLPAREDSMPAPSIRDLCREFLAAHAAYREADRASLNGASLDRASLIGASLDGASLNGARLNGARLNGASLNRARLIGASLNRASLIGASLNRASLIGASLIGASLIGASLDGANIEAADLSRIKADLYSVLEVVPSEAVGLHLAIREGRIDGSAYQGECACLVGTISNLKRCAYTSVPGLVPDADRFAERWFLGISKGDTPESNPISRITAGWVAEWIAAHQSQECAS
jgi:Pentapeptide repeats (8 copies)